MHSNATPIARSKRLLLEGIKKNPRQALKSLPGIRFQNTHIDGPTSRSGALTYFQNWKRTCPWNVRVPLLLSLHPHKISPNWPTPPRPCPLGAKYGMNGVG